MRRSQEDGFTLIESLVALAITGMIASVLLQGVVTVRQVASRMVVAQRAGEDVASAQSVLRSAIGQLRAVPRSDRAEPVLDLDGDDRHFSFYGPPLRGAGPDALQAYRLQLSPDGDLTLFTASSLVDALQLRSSTLEGRRAMRLIGGVKELSLSYFGPAATGGYAWRRFWYDERQPPLLIRVSLTFPEGDRRRWPDLLVRPMVTTNTACRIDPVTSRCMQGVGA